ncbi:hypothetical protein [Jatrophihabitans endophyticus]|nr:hypothetical protein [Jatrophihabitans endophyticus]MBE7190694.1 hypothetical protein [Jatrophihabitans endophyticus]
MRPRRVRRILVAARAVAFLLAVSIGTFVAVGYLNGWGDLAGSGAGHA